MLNIVMLIKLFRIIFFEISFKHECWLISIHFHVVNFWFKGCHCRLRSDTWYFERISDVMIFQWHNNPDLAQNTFFSEKSTCLHYTISFSSPGRTSGMPADSCDAFVLPAAPRMDHSMSNGSSDFVSPSGFPRELLLSLKQTWTAWIFLEQS